MAWPPIHYRASTSGMTGDRAPACGVLRLSAAARSGGRAHLRRTCSNVANSPQDGCRLFYRLNGRGSADAEGADMLGGRPHGQSSARWKTPSGLTPDELVRLASMAAVIVALHLIGWITLVVVVEPAHLTVGGKAFGIGIGITAYTLGLRHAFD